MWKCAKKLAIFILKSVCYNEPNQTKQVINMNTFSIHNPFSTGMTGIPNYFLDHYMPKANGEFVKIYLYLLRISSANAPFSLNSLADCMNCTEADVLRAMKYWEKEGLLQMTFDGSDKLTGLSFTDLMMRNHTENNQSAAVSASGKQNSSTYSAESAAPGAASAAASNSEKAVPKRYTLTADKVKQLKENEDIAQLLFIAQQYLGKTLTPTETNRILFFYDGLGLSVDLIEYLIEYCVSKGHKSMHYIEKVAFAWKEDGITDVASAKASSEGYQKDYYTILKALGIRGRNPIDAEIEIMKTWQNEYGFTLDLIVEACTRTILATKQPSMQYADRILQSWKKANVHSMADVHRLDQAHEQNKASKSVKKAPKTTATTKFSNFEQRNYDFDSLESQLLNQ